MRTFLASAGVCLLLVTGSALMWREASAGPSAAVATAQRTALLAITVLPTANYAALKTDILAAADAPMQALEADPTNADKAFAVADLYNLTASPDFWVWRTRVTKDEFVNGTSVDGTTFNWTGTGFITRSQGERDAFQQMFMSGSVNPALPQVRTAFTDIFSGGTAPAPANRTHLATISRRKATRAEKLLGAGTGSTASPATMTFEGQLNFQDVLNAMASQ